MTAKSSDSLIEFYQTTWEGREAFAVRDNGVGFDMAYAGMLFAPFQMMHSSEDFPGRGVGLAIARRIIGRHGGKIRAQSSPGKGATFTFTL
jgi:light-regulated signal transduction histidine kinase (bacteriophytochrome)